MTRVIFLKNPSTPTDPYATHFAATSRTPYFIPLLTHTHNDKLATRTYLTSHRFLHDTPRFIITSQRAVEMFNDVIQTLPRNAQRIIVAKIGYTVGPATFHLLRDAGFSDVRGGMKAGNGAKLSEMILDDVGGSSEERIVFFTGVVRKDVIPRRLATLANFEEFVMYATFERDDIVENFVNCVENGSGGGGEDKDKGGWIVFFSPQGTSDIIKFLKSSKGSGWRIACIGPTTQEYLVANGLAPHVVAAKPDPESLLHAIQNYKE
ncbi:uncharacterized protein LODBEIA_P37240 [Lodderomyces beijingensis]|uniref:Tetrapyrrole biosynthesis uroporphyrinogen III synthase domain-containing protein n=1 Tax=Lodderomyces beijingensis TaxID=1775926 RepID=A0ABP0ZQN7_9ASCO